MKREELNRRCIERGKYMTCINPHEYCYRGCTDKCPYYATAESPLPPAEGAEEILTSLIKSLGEPTKIHNHIYEIRPYTVESKTEWWMFHKGVGSGEPLAQWLNKFATLHAQRLAEKMVEKQMPSNKQIHERPIQGYQPLDKLDTSTPPCEVVLDAKGGFSADE